MKKINSIILPFFYKFQNQYFNLYPIKNILSNRVLKKGIDIEFPDNRDYVHEYRVKEIAKNIYCDINDGIIDNQNFFLKDYLTPQLSYFLNEVSKNVNKKYSKDIEFNKVEILNKYESYGFVKCNNKMLGLFNKQELTHEIIAGMIGPEMSYVWDQKPIKQILILSIESNLNNSIFKLERDLMLKDNEWILSDINYI